ncbi:MAG: MATE family efflux transporter [Alloprevotella sp.]|nr:MATE family efflux transporter [Alloprevotella sp.]
MAKSTKTSERLLSLLRDGRPLSRRQQMALVFQLSLPAMLAQIATIVMFFIDAAMVGHLGATEAASVGLVETTFWLFGGLTGALATGFYVQVAHRIGAKDDEGARAVLREGFTTALLFSSIVGLFGVIISGPLPHWLGGDADVAGGATTYFLLFSLFAPFMQLNQLSAGMLRCAGDIKTPSVMEALLCIFDVVLNFLLIFPTKTYDILGLPVTVPGAGLGVAGAALGTGLAFAIVASTLTLIVFHRHGPLRILGERWEGWWAFRPRRATLVQAWGIGMPIGVQHTLMSCAQVFVTMIVAPLGAFAIAANSFAVTAESICYMPGYGISDAATTLVGQSVGARRWNMARQLAGVSVGMAMTIMALMGVVLYFGAELVMDIMTPQAEIIALGASALRIEAFAEPMFAASIVCYGAFVGAGSTKVPALMNLASMWGVRITLALLLVGSMGLDGVWTAMAIELTFRGTIFLLRLRSRSWLPGGAA